MPLDPPSIIIPLEEPVESRFQPFSPLAPPFEGLANHLSLSWEIMMAYRSKCLRGLAAVVWILIILQAGKTAPGGL